MNNNNTNSTKPSVPLSTHGNLLGKVDLDDEDELLTKYQSKKLPMQFNENDFTSSMNKFNSNIQTMIDSKWNQYKTSFHDNDDDDDDDDDEEQQQQDEEDEEDLYSRPRQRTSSRSSAIHSKISVVQPKKV
jgi:hypothetical protein